MIILKNIFYSTPFAPLQSPCLDCDNFTVSRTKRFASFYRIFEINLKTVPRYALCVMSCADFFAPSQSRRGLRRNRFDGSSPLKRDCCMTKINLKTAPRYALCVMSYADFFPRISSNSAFSIVSLTNKAATIFSISAFLVLIIFMAVFTA